MVSYDPKFWVDSELLWDEHYVQGKQDQTVNYVAGFLLFVFFDASVKLKVGEPSVSLPSPLNTLSESSNKPAREVFPK